MSWYSINTTQISQGTVTDSHGISHKDTINTTQISQGTVTFGSQL